MQLIACQPDIAWEDKPANYRRVRELLDRVDIQPGALIALPEMFATGFSMNAAAIAEPHDGETARCCAELAQQHQAHVLAGLVTQQNNAHHNTAFVFDPAGRRIAEYHKMQPMTVAGETDHYTAGDEVVTFTCNGFTVAPFICYDLRFPELFRIAAARGAQLMPVIANWPAVRAHHWVTLLQARAIENQCYVLGVNRTGHCAPLDLEYRGRSIIIDPRGEILADAGDAETALTCDIDLAPLLDYRAKFPAVADRRANTPQ